MCDLCEPLCKQEGFKYYAGESKQYLLKYCAVRAIMFVCISTHSYSQCEHVEASDNAKHNIRHIHFLSANNVCLQTV